MNNSKKFECALGYHEEIKVKFQVVPESKQKGAIITISTYVCAHCRKFTRPVGFPKEMKKEYTKTGRTTFSWEEFHKDFPDDDAIKR